jgi:hypothetical protein
MLKAIATPYHIKLLLELLLVVSHKSKLMIIKILTSFISNEIPEEVFNQAISSQLFPDKISKVYDSKKAFSNFLYEYALRIRMSKYDVKGKEQDMYTTSKQLLKLSVSFAHDT